MHIGTAPITVQTTRKGESLLEDLMDGEYLTIPIDIFEEAILKYIHNSPQHTLRLNNPEVQIGTKGVEGLTYMVDNNLVVVL